jgi:hypothetical protein
MHTMQIPCLGAATLAVAALLLCTESWVGAGAPGEAIGRPAKPTPPLEMVQRVPLDKYENRSGFHTLDYAGLGYQVRVITASPRAVIGTGFEGSIPLLFCWPTRDVIARGGQPGSPLASVDAGTGEVTLQWLDKVVGPRKATDPQARLFQEGRSVYYLQYGDGLMVRVVRDPLDITLNWPAEVQILHEEAITPDKLNQLQKSLATGSVTKPLILTEVAPLNEILAAIPLSELLKKAKWGLQRYDCNLNWQKVTAVFTAVVDRLPFELRATVGQGGTLVQISGLGLEALGDPEYMKRLQTPVEPQRTVPKPTSAPGGAKNVP